MFKTIIAESLFVTVLVVAANLTFLGVSQRPFKGQATQIDGQEVLLSEMCKACNSSCCPH